MNEMSVRAHTVYQSTRDVHVINNFSPGDNHFMAWIIAMARCSRDSVIVFDNQLKVVFMNNAWGTFENAFSVKNIADVMINIHNMYHNPGMLQIALEHTIRYQEPRNFFLHMLNGQDAICRSYPVIDRGSLTGAILSAWKDTDTSTTQKGTSTCITKI